MKKMLFLLSVLLIGLGQVKAATQKAYADFSNPSVSANAAWDAETNTMSWSVVYGNQIRNLGLPSGNLTNYEKIVVDCADLNAKSFRILIYVGSDAAGTIVVNQAGVTEYKLKDYVSTSNLEKVTEVCLSGGNEDGTGSVRILNLYMETFDDTVVQKKEAGLSFSTALVLMEPGEPFKAPTLNNPNNLPVTYSATSTPEGAVSVDATTGMVTLAEGELSGNVTATFAGNDEYEAGSASYAIRVKKSAEVEGIPLVYNVENTAADLPDPIFPSPSELPYIEPLTDPFEYSDGSGRALEFKDWTRRRGEIARELQHYELGEKPAVSMDDIEAWMDGNTLYVKVTVGENSLTINTTITYPSKGEAPYALMIGTDNISLPAQLITSRPIARLNLPASQVNGYSQMGGNSSREFKRLYPQYEANGAYIEWAWGLSRIIDGLQKLGPEVTKIDMSHIGVTGCSYAGKMALFTGVFDERVALTIAQEPGGGGANAWRVSRVWNRDYYSSKDDDACEGLDNTDYSWFMKSLKDNFAKDNTFKLPYDHHELVAMACPRAVLVLGNPDMKWLGDYSGYVSVNAARKVYERYGIADRCGYSIVGGHGHCQLPENQYADVEAFLDRFLLGKDVDTNITKAPVFENGSHKAAPLVELGQWMDWWESENHEPNTLETGRPESVMFWGGADDMVPAGCTQWAVEYDETAAEGKMAHSTNEASNKTVPEDKGAALQFTFNSPAKQKYYIYAFVNCAKSSNDAVWVAFDDNTAYKSNGANTKGEWAWKNLTALIAKADQTKFVSTLDVGEHTLYIYPAELNYKISKICVTNVETLDEFKTAIKDIDLDMIGTGIEADGVKEMIDIQYYTLDGRPVSKLRTGVNVVRERLKNGQIRTKKIVVTQ